MTQIFDWTLERRSCVPTPELGNDNQLQESHRPSQQAAHRLPHVGNGLILQPGFDRYGQRDEIILRLVSGLVLSG
jgi:hypothetical protein